jgi:CHASE2 domain-containing sensor protein
MLKQLFKPNPFTLKPFLINLTIVSLTVSVFYFYGHHPLFHGLKDKVLDSIMYWHSDFLPKLANGDEMERLVIVKIDDASYRTWGSPVITPRDKLKTLIEAAVTGGAKVIAVDLALSWHSDGCLHDPGQPVNCPTTDLSGDKTLGDYLRTLNDRTDANAPVIVLTRLYRRPLTKTGALNTTANLQSVPSFLDTYLPEEKRVFWSSPFFQVDDDKVIRRWQLATLVCQPDNHLTLVPSMQLLITIAKRYLSPAGETTEAVSQIQQLKQQWAQAGPCQTDASQVPTLAQWCASQNQCTVTLPAQPRVSDQVHTIHLATGREQERVIYRFAPSDKPNPNRLMLTLERSAQQIITDGASDLPLQNRIVLIGTTHQDNGDKHRIPIRTHLVDGVYVIANAVDTLLRLGQLTAQTDLTKGMAYGIVILTATLIFTFYEVITAHLLSLCVVGLALYLWSIQALGRGMEIDIALPLLVFQVLVICWHWIENLIHMIKRIGGHSHD